MTKKVEILNVLYNPNSELTPGYHIGCFPRDWEGLEEHDFEKTIALTSEALKLNPYNKNAYFSRGIAYFELGKFDEAIADYISSGEGAYASKSFYQASKEFSQSFLSGVFTGSSESAQEFVPSLCHTTCGIGRTLWTAFNHPIESTKELIGASYEVGECVVDYCRNLDWETIEGYTEHAKEVCQSFLKLSEAEKGELIGYTIGKYGTEVFTGALVGGTAYKGAEVLQKLRNANRICNLEVMATSAVSKEIIVSAATEHTICRETYFKTVKYNYNDHNKHIVGHTHYDLDKNRSIWEHKDPEKLLREFAGKGIPHKGTPGASGYRETIDFGEHIGMWISDSGLIKRPTTRGTIHYGKKGAHIVPSNPNPKINNLLE
jgi:hypothetical protein